MNTSSREPTAIPTSLLKCSSSFPSLTRLTFIAFASGQLTFERYTVYTYDKSHTVSPQHGDVGLSRLSRKPGIE